MAGDSSAALLHNMHALFDAGTASGLTDRQLLERFTAKSGAAAEAAFEVLLSRHGPMVLRVCSSGLRDPTDTEDAFQATFLVLLRRWRSIKKLESVGSWLYGVAHRVSARARVEAGRRRAAERRGGLRVVAAESSDGDSVHELAESGRAILEEVRRLPEKYRVVVVLCYWEGLTHEQAAAQLGRPLGTVRSRLARARVLLHRRLSRRGLAPLAGVVTAALSGAPVEAVVVPLVPSALTTATLKAGGQFLAGCTMASVTCTAVAALVQQTIRSMVMTTFGMRAITLVIFGIGALGVSLGAPQAGSRKPPDSSRRDAVPRPEKSKAQPGLVVHGSYVVEPPDLLLVEVLEALPGRPISGERLVRPDGKISLGFYGDVSVAGLTVPEIKEKIIRHLQKFVSAEALGLGPDDPRPSSFGASRRATGTGEPTGDADRKDKKSINPRESSTVFVDVAAYNSKFYYVQGEVREPGRFQVTGQETVLDAVNLAGGVGPRADHLGVVIYRPGAQGEALRAMRVDIDQITMGDDLSTNYQLMPGDRLVVPRDARIERDAAATVADTSKPDSASDSLGDLHFDRRTETPDRSPEIPGSTHRIDGRGGALLGVERRLSEVERKLDLILEAIDRGRRESK
jgi:RNA polymerase sigma factor (sigma-70 family)